MIAVDDPICKVDVSVLICPIHIAPIIAGEMYDFINAFSVFINAWLDFIFRAVW